jgi:enoyl-CoA hydratase/carnithine racemase
MRLAYGDQVSAALDGHVAVVTIDAPPHNFVSLELIAALADALEDLGKNRDCRAIVLSTTGKSFCAGAQLDPGASNARTGGVRPKHTLYDEAIRLFAAPTPIVAAVQGAAVGAGLGLALVADFRVASPEARFTANFVKLGFHPGFGLTHTLPRLIGERRAELMFLTGRRIKPDQALEWGLVDDVAPAEKLLEAAIALAREIAENAPLAVEETRRTLRGDLAEKVRAQTTHELEQQFKLIRTEDFAEGVRAVNERRPGVFVGR